MSSRAQETVLLAPDPVLPRRDDLLDDQVVGPRLAELLDQVPDDRSGTCERVRAKYRRGESLRASYRIGPEPGGLLVSARMFPAAEAPGQFLRARDAAVGQGADPRSVLFDEETSTVFWVFPQDRKLRRPSPADQPATGAPDVFGAPWTQSELMAYTPEKAATVRCADARGATVGFAKLQSGDDGRRSVATLRAARRGIAEHGGPAPAGCDRLPARPAPGAVLARARSAAPPAGPGRLPGRHGRARRRALGAARSADRRVRAVHPAGSRSAGGRGHLVRAARPDLGPVTEALVGELLTDRTATRSERPAARRPAPQERAGARQRRQPRRPRPGGRRDRPPPSSAACWPGSGARARVTRSTPTRPRAAAEALLAAYHRAPSRADLLWYAAAALLVERAARAISRVDVATIGDLERVLATALRWAGHQGADR